MDISMDKARAKHVAALETYIGDGTGSGLPLAWALADYYVRGMCDAWDWVSEDVGASWDASRDSDTPSWDALTPRQRGEYVGRYAAECARAAIEHLQEWDVTGYCPDALEVWGGDAAMTYAVTYEWADGESGGRLLCGTHDTPRAAVSAALTEWDALAPDSGTYDLILVDVYTCDSAEHAEDWLGGAGQYEPGDVLHMAWPYD